MDGRPLAAAIGALKWKDKTVLATIVDLDGKRELQWRTADGQKHRQKLSDSFKATPASLVIHDLDQDGTPDLIALIPYEKSKVFLNRGGEDMKELDITTPGGGTDQPWVSAADVDGDGKEELLLAQRNFIRAVVLHSGEDGTNFEVKEQINAAASNSRIVAAAAVPKPGSDTPALFLLDAERKALTLSERNSSGVWQVVRTMPLPYTDFTSLRPIQIGAKEQNAVSLIGLNVVAWQQLNGDVWQLTELDGYETPIKDGYLNDVVSGDLNQDGRKDLVFLETGKSYLDLVTYEEPHNLVPATRWQVFEERTFRSRRTDLPEPREALIADFTGDGKNDLVVMVHDRLLLYPQE
jgi:hypothetical protein